MWGKFSMEYINVNFFNFVNLVKGPSMPKESTYSCDVLPPVPATYFFNIIISDICWYKSNSEHAGPLTV